MPRKYLTLFCFLFLVSFTAAKHSGRKCVDGRSYFDGCNHVYCANGHIIKSLKECRDIHVIEAPEDFWEPQEDA
ncbi:uncharacterized protein [Fopius arisanus]|uniref:Uncharacterized protein n=1 Tax=Fopius arisanus TaxID=64838 RepID=A0A9R1TUW3_9HYME|nr:PREDICTED: uncharacterized protein LOC105274072 [Fopius arisanus]